MHRSFPRRSLHLPVVAERPQAKLALVFRSPGLWPGDSLFLLMWINAIVYNYVTNLFLTLTLIRAKL